MKPARFDYVRPDTLSEALTILKEQGEEASVLAGGQSLVPMMNLRLASPGILVDINALAELKRIEREDDVVVIGALARHNEVLRSSVVRAGAPLLSEALSFVAHEAVRNRGTIGGSLSLADPASELPACAVCLGASLVLKSTMGERRIAAADFFEDIYTTAILSGELLAEVEIPVLDGWRFGFDEVARRHGDFALAGLALGVRLDGDRVAECRIVFAGVESAPRRLASLEQRLVGLLAGDAAAAQAALDALDEIEPMESPNCPADYRRHLARVLLCRLWQRVGEKRT